MALVVLAIAGLHAGASATLTGRVADVAGEGMKGVNVTAVNVELGLRFASITNDEGFYRILHLPPGLYRVVVQKHGFRTVIRTGLELHVQDIVALNLEMQMGSVSVNVSGSQGAPLIQAEGAELGQVIDQSILREMPTLTRNPYDFIGLNGGAVAAQNSNGRGIGVALNGQRSESAGFLLDGTENTNRGAQTPGVTVPTDAVREYRIVTNSAGAEHGRTGGFTANLVTKTGSNDFHGSVYDYIRNSALSANSFENNARRLPRAKFNRHQTGASLGGPVVPDRTFFFGSFESIQVRSSDARSFLVPTPELIAISSPSIQSIFRRYPLPPDLSRSERVFRSSVPRYGFLDLTSLPVFATVTRHGPVDAGAGIPQSTALLTVRADHTVDARTSVNARYSLEKRDHFAIVRQPYSSELDQSAFTRNQSAAVNLVRTWSTGAISDSRIGFNRYTTTRPEAGPLGLFSTFRISGENVDLPTGQQSSAAIRNLLQVNQSVNVVHGAHSIKLGGATIWAREAIGANTPIGGVRPSFPDLGWFVEGQLLTTQVELDFVANGRLPGDVVRGPITPPNRRRHAGYVDLATYVEDTWKINRRLTATAGIRWEYFGVPSGPGHERALDANFYPGEGKGYFERFARGAFLNTADAPGRYRDHLVMPDRNNIGPRLGIAYALTPSGRTVLRSGVALLYDGVHARNAGPLVGRVEFFNVPFSSAMLDNPYDLRGQGTTPAPSTTLIDPDLRTPVVAHWNTTIEHEFQSALVLSASWVGTMGRGLPALTVANATGSGYVVGRPEQRLLPRFGAFLVTRGLADSLYNGLQIRASSQRLHPVGLTFGVAYTWSHSIDTASSYDHEGDGFSQGVLLDATNPRLDRGDSSFDQRQRLVGHFMWQVPVVRTSTALRYLTTGWQVSGVISAQAGQPFHLYDDGQLDREFSPVRPHVVGTLPRVLKESEMPADPVVPNRYLYLPANRIRVSGACIAFASPFACVRSLSDRGLNLLPRSAYRRPGTVFQDIAITKEVPISDAVRMQLRAELYNAVNHSNLELAPSGQNGLRLDSPYFAGSTTPGVVVRYGGTPRQVVLAARIVF